VTVLAIRRWRNMSERNEQLGQGRSGRDCGACIRNCALCRADLAADTDAAMPKAHGLIEADAEKTRH
jgi:hypothetical protein